LQKKDIEELEILDDMLFEVHYNERDHEEMITSRYFSIGLFDVTTPESKLIGVSTSSREWRNFYSAERDAYLATFGIHPDYRKMKLGTYLLLVTCQALKKFYGCNVLTLHMLKSNRAAFYFYQNNNFLFVKSLPRYYHFQNQRHDALFLIKYLDTFQFTPLPSNITIDSTIQPYLETTQRHCCCSRYFSDP